MRHHHRGTILTIAGGHLLAALLTYRAGVPIASPVVLVLAALAALGLGFTRPAHAVDTRHPQLGHIGTGAAAHGTARDPEGEPDPGPAKGSATATHHHGRDDEQPGQDKGAA